VLRGAGSWLVGIKKKHDILVCNQDIYSYIMYKYGHMKEFMEPWDGRDQPAIHYQYSAHRAGRDLAGGMWDW
jgi:hypothetical protein